MTGDAVENPKGTDAEVVAEFLQGPCTECGHRYTVDTHIYGLRTCCPDCSHDILTCEALDRILAELQQVKERVASQEFLKECADTPLMRDVLDERDTLRTENERYREALERISKGDWNFGNLAPGLQVSEYAERALTGEAL